MCRELRPRYNEIRSMKGHTSGRLTAHRPNSTQTDNHHLDNPSKRSQRMSQRVAFMSDHLRRNFRRRGGYNFNGCSSITSQRIRCCHVIWFNNFRDWCIFIGCGRNSRRFVCIFGIWGRWLIFFCNHYWCQRRQLSVSITRLNSNVFRATKQTKDNKSNIEIFKMQRMPRDMFGTWFWFQNLAEAEWHFRGCLVPILNPILWAIRRHRRLPGSGKTSNVLMKTYLIKNYAGKMLCVMIFGYAGECFWSLLPFERTIFSFELLLS